MKCGVCSRDWPDERCHILTLTDEEKAYAKAATGKPAPATYSYCGPCWKLTSNRMQGAQFIAGSFKASLRAASHPKAEKMGDRLLKFLVAKSGKPVS